MTASQEFVHSWGDDLAEVNEALAEVFGNDGHWCRVGPDVYTVGIGDPEYRLRGSTVGWHVDLFQSSWAPEFGELREVPAKYRQAVAAYIDARDRLTMPPPKVEELRQRGEPEDTAAVHALVGHHLVLLEDQLRALDALQVSLSEEARCQPWASRFLSKECQEIKERQDCVSASLVEYHLGEAGTRVNIWFWEQGFDLPGGFIPLLPDSAPAPETAAV
ncbi:hypothetical protein ACFWXO_22105 [Kitasatospora sp. NPDC059088]|uniref:hypothetical protein n=1 Tax=Kitasatospora sp. NPDC059088 TaxID=3346722 RepID=UPI0036A82AF1